MSVLVLLEQRGELKPGAIEAATAANQIAKAAGLPLNAVFVGQALGDQVSRLAGLGIAKVFAYENEALAHYSNDTYVPIIRDLAKELGATVIIGTASALGKELCASVAARLGVELAQDAIGVRWDGGLVASKPVYAGKVLSEVKITSTPAMVSLRPNVTKVERDGDAVPAVETRPMRRGRGREPRGGRCGLGAPWPSGGTDRQGGKPGHLRRVRHQRRDSASGRHAHLQDYRGNQQGPERLHFQVLRLRHRGRRVRSLPTARR